MATSLHNLTSHIAYPELESIGRPCIIMAYRMSGTGLRYLEEEMGQGELLRLGRGATPQERFPSRPGHGQNRQPTTTAASAFVPTTFFRFSDLPAELRTKVYTYYAEDEANIPAELIILGHTDNGRYERTSDATSVNLSILQVSRLVREESQAIFHKELAKRPFLMNWHDNTMLQSPVEQAMLRGFGSCLQTIQLARGGILVCLSALAPFTSALQTLDVQCASHPRYRQCALNHDFPLEWDSIDVQEMLDGHALVLLQRLFDVSPMITAMTVDYAGAVATFPNLFVPGRLWRVRFVIRAYLHVEKEDRRWRLKVAFDAETGVVEEVEVLPIDKVIFFK